MSTNSPKSVQFAGRTLNVFEVLPTLRTQLIISTVRNQIIESIKEKMVTAAEFFYYNDVYPLLTVCTKAEDGNPIPSADEVLDSTDAAGADAWYEAVREMNPHLFPTQAEEPAPGTDEVVTVEEREKKKRKRSR